MKHGEIKYRTEVEQIIVENFLPIYKQRLNDKAEFIQKYEESVSQILKNDFSKTSKHGALRLLSDHRKQVEELVEKNVKESISRDFDTDFKEFNTQLNLLLSEVKEEIKLDQPSERFTLLKSDSWAIRQGKRLKKVTRRVTGWPHAISNYFKKLAGNYVKKRPLAKHKVKLQDLVAFYYKERLSYELATQSESYYIQISQAFQLLWQADEALNRSLNSFIENGGKVSLPEEYDELLANARALIKNHLNTLENAAISTLDLVDKTFHDDLQRVGTFELSNKKFKPTKSKKLHTRTKLKYKTLFNNWSNTLTALSDDWEIDVEVYAIIYSGLSSFYANEDKLSNRINDRIINEIDKIIDEVEKSSKTLEGFEGKSIKDIKATLEREMDLIRDKLEGNLVPKVTETILAQNLPSLINDVEEKLNKEVISITERRAISKGSDYNLPTKTSALNYIYPGELINFEIWPLFQKAIQDCKGKVTTNINELQNELSDIAHIALFNLDSAAKLLVEEKDKNKAIKVASDGLSRTIAKAENLKTHLNKIEEVVGKELLSSLKELNKSLDEFTDNENIFAIRLRIAKAKAIEKSKKIRNESIEKLKNLLPSIWRFIKRHVYSFKEKFNDVVQHYGLSKEKNEVTSEVADFLSENQKALEKLPFVYQRLFRSAPLDDPNLFEGRMYEMNTLINAYNNFTKEHFASVVVLGEKGSGISSLLNFFEEELGSSYEIFRFNTERAFSSEKEFLSFYAKNFNKKFNDVNELIKYLLEGPKKIVIVENIQKQFLKKVNGFEAIRLLVDIISLTSKNVFWVNTCTIYAWNYLNKTIGLSEHYGYHIKLGVIEEKVMIKLINKRHKVSGYNLKFEPAPSHLNNKKFNKLSEEEQQNTLRNEYFEDLNKIVKSNIGLALVYWQRSTCEVSENTIYIDSIKKMDFRFIENLSANKLHALTYLLLHDGLTEADFVTCTYKSLSAARSIIYPMYEDGILIKKENEFLINPLLYRQLVDLLNSKNIIH